MESLRVVALISGGKDSFFSILHCQSNGHQVVALANLHPPGADTADMDSFMYQTIGHTVLPLYEEALGLPLYRQKIMGTALNQNKSYNSSRSTGDTSFSTDEVEDMLQLLTKVKAAQPEVNAVCTGAILSDYQRTRVESVAIRLGLTPLSYLWQYPFLPPYSETSLLDDMADIGQDSRIIKVASAGLDERFLWANVADRSVKERLVKAIHRYGSSGIGAALGEGGEFETLAVNGPTSLWKRRVCVNDQNRTVDSGEAGSVSVSIRNATTEQNSHDETILKPRRPPLLDDIFEVAESRLRHTLTSSEQKMYAVQTDKQKVSWLPTWSSRQVGLEFTICNAVAAGETAASQMRTIMIELVHGQLKIDPARITFTTILLRSMADFAAVNTAYGSFFTTANPPARVTVSCGNALPAEVHVMVSFSVIRIDAVEARRGLHVQSRSYWAPANIGPYSQAVSIPFNHQSEDGKAALSLVHIAGQIPLEPATMALPSSIGMPTSIDSILRHNILALQHLWRIGQIMEVNLWLGGVAFVSREAVSLSSVWVEAAFSTWSAICAGADHDDDPMEEDDQPDIWDQKYGGQAVSSMPRSTYKDCIRRDVDVPCIVAEVEQLPRNAPIEYASMGFCADRPFTASSRTKRSTTSRYNERSLTIGMDGIVLDWTWMSFTDEQDLRTVLKGQPQMIESIHTVYLTGGIDLRDVGFQLKAQFVPAHRLWDFDRAEAVAILITSTQADGASFA